jgi:hypothetical protein
MKGDYHRLDESASIFGCAVESSVCI